MSVSTDNAGIACCGNCGSHVVVACSGGCAEPDVVFRDNLVASLPKPAPVRKRKRGAVRVHSSAICNWAGGCTDRVAPPPSGRGRHPTKCPKHLAITQRYLGNYVRKKAGKV